jgi:hypothetical protein
MTTTTEKKVHRFEKDGLGIGPFKFLTVLSYPNPALAGTYPDAYNQQIKSLTTAAKALGVGGHLGICGSCGMALVHNAVIEDARGERFVVGCDCARKTQDSSLADRAKVEMAWIRREKAREARERKAAERHAKWLDTVCNAAGETNRQRIDREDQERLTQREEEARRADAVRAAWEFWVTTTMDNNSPFVDSIRASIRRGDAPTGRGLAICREIYGKEFGRKGSKAYDQAVEIFDENLGL